MQKTVVTYVDDLTGKESENVETVTFTVQGKAFEIDLNEFNKRNFFRSLNKYMEKGRQVRANGRTQHTHRVKRDIRHDREYVHTVRKWAQDNGIEVSDRGRVPLDVYDQYEKANR